MAALLIPLLRCAPLTFNQTCAEIVLEDPLQKPDELGVFGVVGSVITDRFWGGELRTPTREHRVASRGSGDATAAEVRLFGIVFDLTTTRVSCRRQEKELHETTYSSALQQPCTRAQGSARHMQGPHHPGNRSRSIHPLHSNRCMQRSSDGLRRGQTRDRKAPSLDLGRSATHKLSRPRVRAHSRCRTTTAIRGNKRNHRN